MAFAPTSKGVLQVGSFGGLVWDKARMGKVAWDEGTARDHMQLCTKPAWKSAHSRSVGSFGLALGHPKAQPQGLLPTGAVWTLLLVSQTAPGSPKMLLRGCSGSWALKQGLGELVGPSSSSVQGKCPPLELHPQGRRASTCSHTGGGHGPPQWAGAATLPGAMAGQF